VNCIAISGCAINREDEWGFHVTVKKISIDLFLIFPKLADQITQKTQKNQV
jgi:hypothetical protein